LTIELSLDGENYINFTTLKAAEILWFNYILLEKQFHKPGNTPLQRTVHLINTVKRREWDGLD